MDYAMVACEAHIRLLKWRVEHLRTGLRQVDRMLAFDRCSPNSRVREHIVWVLRG